MYIHIYIFLGVCESAQRVGRTRARRESFTPARRDQFPVSHPLPHLLRIHRGGFIQRFDLENHFGAGVFSGLRVLVRFTSGYVFTRSSSEPLLWSYSGLGLGFRVQD